MFPMIGYKKLLLILLVLEAFRSHSQVSSYPLMIDTNELNDDEELLNPSFRMYNGLDKRDKFAYMISPISQQLIQLWDQSSSKPQEETRYIDPTILWPFPFNETSTTISTTTTTTTNVNDELNSCITSSSDIQLERENTDTLNKQVRTCRGFVRLNRCEGKCHSSAEPSVLSRNGIKQNCLCCSELTFRRVKVRLDECYSANIDSASLIRKDPSDPMSFMDIEVDEPIGCQCRRCEGFNA